ncbi:MAG: hypothetical protein EA428_01965 [Spirochaetaceae bacterium]|nr:MAG: hypothetical protein EA428_01965 [Spirochaetaceae bacterium]
MQNLICRALIFLALFFSISDQAMALEEIEHGTQELNGPQFDPLGGLAESVASVEVYEHQPGVAPTSEPVARLQQTASGTTEHRKMGSSPLDTDSSTLVRNYDTDGLLVQEYTVDTLGIKQQRKAFLYDGHGRIQQVTNYQRQDAVESALVFLYAEDLLGEVAVYEADGRPRWRRVYEYPEEHVVRWSLLHADGRLQQAGEFIYDEASVLQEHRSLDENTMLTERRVFEYDNENRAVTISTFDADKELIEKYSFVYDSAGNLLRRVIEDGNGHPVSVTQYRYTYDEHGSWIRVDTFLVEARRERPFQVRQNVLTRDINYDSSN